MLLKTAVNRCFFHFNLNCQFRETDRQAKGLCNLHYRLSTLPSLYDYYTAAYKENYGNCPQCVSLLIDFNFTSILATFLDSFSSYQKFTQHRLQIKPQKIPIFPLSTRIHIVTSCPLSTCHYNISFPRHTFALRTYFYTLLSQVYNSVLICCKLK